MADNYSSSTAQPVQGVADNLNRRRLLELLRTQMESERSSFIAHWRDLNDYILPRRARFFTPDVNRGDRRNLKIMDTTATLSARTLRAGMLSGIMSPARPWFQLHSGNPHLDEVQRVKQWCYDTADAMRMVHLRSNLYSTAPVIFGDMGTFAIGAMLIEEDFSGRVMKFTALPIGSYCIGNDDDLRVRIFYREFRMTVQQIVRKFVKTDASGKILDDSNISTVVKTLWENGNSQAWVDVVHFIVPAQLYNPSGGKGQVKKPYYSVYYERGVTSTSSTNYMSPADADSKRFLRESGYSYFPVLAPRWEVTAGDVYGTDCPGMTALPDIRTLQLGEKRAWQAVEKQINPPMVGPSGLRNTKASILPGDITYVDEREGQKGFRAAHEVQFPINQLEEKLAQTRERIKRAFYEDLFLMLQEDERQQPATATEIVEKKEEKLIALGPVLSQFNQDFLDPLVEITFDMMSRQNMIPPPPPELQGQPLHVEYISILAQAMKIAGIGNLERFGGFLGNIVSQTGDPSLIKYKVNIDKFIDVYGDGLTLPPGIIRTDDEADALRQQDQKAAQQAQATENAAKMAGAAKDLSQSKTDEPSALTDLIQQSKAGQVVPQ